MLPTTADGPQQDRPGCTISGAELQPLSRPLQSSLLSPNSALHSKEMDGMAEMLSSDHQEINSQPVSAELETEVRLSDQAGSMLLHIMQHAACSTLLEVNHC